MTKHVAIPSVQTEDSVPDIAKSNQSSGNIPFLEWVVAVIGFLLVTGAIGFLFYTGMKEEKLPPLIILKIDSIQVSGTNYLVTIKAINQGSETVKELMIEGKLKTKSSEIESSNLTFDYLPSQSERLGGLFFTSDPHNFTIQLRALGYEQP